MNKINSGQFKKGQHWRKPQSFRDKEWLKIHYIEQKMSAADISKMFNVTENAVLYWLKKNEIQTRTMREVRKIKNWGLFRSDNPMWNKRGELNPHWKGGISPERQTFYNTQEWKDVCSKLWERENGTCQRCGLKHNDQKDMPFHTHHIITFMDKDLRAEISNIVLLCEVCHHFIHSKRNINNEFLQKK